MERDWTGRFLRCEEREREVGRVKSSSSRSSIAVRDVHCGFVRRSRSFVGFSQVYHTDGRVIDGICLTTRCALQFSRKRARGATVRFPMLCLYFFFSFIFISKSLSSD